MNIHERISVALLDDGVSYRKFIRYDGITFVVTDSPIEPGDDYLAERNTGPQLMVCKSVNLIDGWIVPEGVGYPYDLNECVKVINMTDN